MVWSSLAPGIALVAGAAAGIQFGPPTGAAWLLPMLVAAAAVLWAQRRRRACTAATTLGYALCGAALAAHAADGALRAPIRALLERKSPGFDIDTLGSRSA